MSWLSTLADAMTARGTAQEVEGRLGPSLLALRQRLGDVPGHLWRDPYVLGFMTGLITQAAQAVRPMGRQALGLLQVGCWERLTGERDAGLGERICLLSGGSDPAFERGWIDAHRVFHCMREAGESGAADYLWSRTIERHLGALMGQVPLDEMRSGAANHLGGQF